MLCGEEKGLSVRKPRWMRVTASDVSETQGESEDGVKTIICLEYVSDQIFLFCDATSCMDTSVFSWKALAAS
jgi:hypothetical protein